MLCMLTPKIVGHAAERLAARRTTHFILVSEANRQQGAALGLFSRSRTSLIRSGVDLARYRDALPDRPGLEARWGIPVDAPLVGMVGCLKPQKAPQDFVEVARRVSQTHPDCHYLLVGDGVLRRSVPPRRPKTDWWDCPTSPTRPIFPRRVSVSRSRQFRSVRPQHPVPGTATTQRRKRPWNRGTQASSDGQNPALEPHPSNSPIG